MVKFCISNISNFLEQKKTIILHNSLIKSRIHTIKNAKIFECFDDYTELNRKKDVKNSKKKTNSKWWNSEDVLYFKYLYFSEEKFKNFPEFSDKIYNSYNKTLQKFLEFFDKFGQVKWEKKMSKMLKE